MLLPSVHPSSSFMSLRLLPSSSADFWSLFSLQGERGDDGSPGAKGYPGRQVQ